MVPSLRIAPHAPRLVQAITSDGEPSSDHALLSHERTHWGSQFIELLDHLKAGCGEAKVSPLS